MDLPLHKGHVPSWLFSRMMKLSSIILKIMIDEYGIKETIKRFSNPVFFQSLNNLIGMDWDSSGSTTITTAVLREVLSREELGIKVLGGKGLKALEISKEIYKIPKHYNVNSEELEKNSRLIAKIDNAALQDGYTLYHQAVIIGEEGSWTIIQQGMNINRRMARRYHWWMETTYLNNPHSGILGIKEKNVLNLTSSKSEECRRVIVDLLNESPVKVLRDYKIIMNIIKSRNSDNILKYLGHHSDDKIDDVRSEVIRNIGLNINEKVILKVRSVNDFKELLLIRGIGPSTILALTLIAELIYNTEADWNDPEVVDPRKFTFAFGGKDGSPYPINKQVYDEVLNILMKVYEKLRSTSGLRIYLKHLYLVSKRLKLPLELVKPTP